MNYSGCRSQCLHPGDRVLSINHRSIALDNLTAKDLNQMLDNKSDEIPCNKLSLHTEFDVLDTVVPASGIFTVKLAKRGTSGLGITITGISSVLLPISPTLKNLGSSNWYYEKAL